MIVIHVQSGRQIICRGQKLGFWRRLLLSFRLPVPVASFAADDLYLVPAYSISHVQFLSDEEGIARKKAQEEEEAKKREAASRIVRMPGMKIPGSGKN